MKKHLISRMVEDMAAYLGKLKPDSAEQVAAAKTLGLIVWFMVEFATVRKVEEHPRVTIERLWESLMVHADDYLSAQTLRALDTAMMIMSYYKEPPE